MEEKLTAEPRAGAGKGVARKMRAAGRVPAVVYGHGVAPVHLSVDAKDLYHVLHTAAGANVLIDLAVGKDRVLAMPREVQRDHLAGRFIQGAAFGGGGCTSLVVAVKASQLAARGHNHGIEKARLGQVPCSQFLQADAERKHGDQ